MGCFSAVTLFFAKKSLNKVAGVLEHCREGETSCWFSISSGKNHLEQGQDSVWDASVLSHCSLLRNS